MYEIHFSETFFEVLASVCVNVTSGWFAVLLIVPGFLETKSFEDYLKLLFTNLPFGIVGFIVTLLLTQRSKTL
jgi:hypothetical protein